MSLSSEKNIVLFPPLPRSCHLLPKVDKSTWLAEVPLHQKYSWVFLSRQPTECLAVSSFMIFFALPLQEFLNCMEKKQKEECRPEGLLYTKEGTRRIIRKIKKLLRSARGCILSRSP